MTKNLMRNTTRWAALAAVLGLALAACSDGDDETSADDPATTEAPAEEPETSTTEAAAEVEEPAEAPYDGEVAALIVRRVTGDLDEFIATRDAYVAELEARDGIVADREFLPFLSFTTFAAPEPPVYIGLTSGASLPEFGGAAGAVSAEAQGAYFPTFEIEAFGILRPLGDGTPVDIASIAIEPGQVLEVAWHDLSAYDDFDPEAYAEARDAYLAGLASFDGFVEEYQWVSADGGTLAVGMTVYESADAFQAIATDAEFTASEVYSAFVGGYPIAGGYASSSVKP